MQPDRMLRIPGNRPCAWHGKDKEHAMELIIEIRAAEGGDDAKLLVREQFALYGKLGVRRGL